MRRIREEYTQSRRAAESLLVAVMMGAMVASAVEVEVFNALTNSATSVVGEYTLTGVGGVQMKSLELTETAVFSLDPLKTPVFVGAVPTFAAGAKIKLASRFSDSAYANGRVTIMSWEGDNAQAALPEGLLDTTGLAGAAPTLVQESYTSTYSPSGSSGTRTYTQLILDMNPSAERKAIKVLPLGDSLTESSGNRGWHASANYRIPLMAKLVARGWDAQSVGYRRTYNLGPDGVAAPEKWSRHNGMCGNRLVPVYLGLGHPKTVSGYRESLEPMIEAAAEPDIILFMIGSNDSNGQAYTIDQLYDSWTNVMWRLIKMRPATKIVCSPILPLGDETNPNAFSNLWREKLYNAIGEGRNVPGFPARQVYYHDVHAACPRWDAEGKATGNFSPANETHPNYVGHDKVSDAWIEGLEAAMAEAKPDGTFVANAKLTAEENVSAAHRNGFRHLYTLDLKAQANRGTLPYGAAVPWDYAAENIDANERFAKVAYYLALKHQRTGHVRWVWADMDTWEGRNLASFGFPTGRRTQRGVTALHVDTNDAALGKVAPTDDSVNGWLQFGWSTIAPTGTVAGAPASAADWDWNDQLNDDTSSKYGCLQVYRVAPRDRPTFAAETLLAFNRWAKEVRFEVGIGNCALGQGTNLTAFNYYNTYSTEELNLAGYEAASLEIWAKPSEGVKLNAEGEAGYDFTNGVVHVQVTGIAEGHETDQLKVTAYDALTGTELGSGTKALSGVGAYDLQLAGDIVAGRDYRYEVTVVTAGGEPVEGAVADTGTIALKASEGKSWFSASPAAGVVNGAWDSEPAISGTSYLMVDGETRRFTVGSSPAASGDYTVVEENVAFESGVREKDFARYDFTGAQGALTLTGDEASGFVWKGLVGGSWTELDGADAAPGAYAIRMEFSYGAGGKLVRYSVKAAGADEYTVLKAGEAEWLGNSKPTANAVTAVGFAGAGLVEGLAGTLPDTDVASFNGTNYASLDVALLAAGQEAVTAVRLRTNATLDPLSVGMGRYTFAAEGYDLKLIREGYRFKLEGDELILSAIPGMIFFFK